MFRVLLIGAVVSMLAACGGGGSWSACSGQNAAALKVYWTSNGQVANTVTGKVNVPLTATPTITGIPASCVGQEFFTLNMALPAGLELNPHTGAISGTPTKSITFTRDSGIVMFGLPGYDGGPILTKIDILP